MKTRTILIADDHRLVAEGIQALLPMDYTCCGIAHTLAHTVALLAQYCPDILLLDIALPDGDGLDALPRLRKASPETRILVLTMYAEGAVVRRALQAKADGYLLKSTDSNELAKALHTVELGDTYLCPEALAQSIQGEAPPSLTPREREVLRLIVEGLTMKEISERLYLGFETIHSYTKYLRQKLGCNNTASLVRTAIEQHLV